MIFFGVLCDMILLNSEGKPKRKKYNKLYKGEIINDLLIIEDIMDMKIRKPENSHRCVCRCLSCGRYHYNVSLRKIKHGIFKCPCKRDSNRENFRHMRGRMLKYLIGRKNRLLAEMLFDEDIQEIKEVDLIIRFLNSKSLDKYFFSNYDYVRGD